MTQDVQPLTWSGRTNVEEHRQLFDKINEIIGNLAPTVDEAEQAIAAANAASAAAGAAAQQAQTAASAVTGYDGRLTAAEGCIDNNTADITALQGRMGTAEGNIASLQGVQADYVKKAGAAQTVTSQIMVPTTAAGLRDAQIANGTRIQNDLAAYEPMIRTTGNQTKAGTMTFVSPIVGQMADLAHFGSNTMAGWYAICKLPKQARELYIMTYTPGNLNFVLIDTNARTVNVVKWTNYIDNQNKFMLAETNDGMILYVYSATYRTNIISILNYSVYGILLSVTDIDRSVFTGQPVTKPEVGGDIIAVCDETILDQVTT